MAPIEREYIGSKVVKIKRFHDKRRVGEIAVILVLDHVPDVSISLGFLSQVPLEEDDDQLPETDNPGSNPVNMAPHIISY